MSALTLRLREEPPERLDLSGLCAALRRDGPLSIEKLPVGTSRMGLVLADCFAVSGGDASDLRIEGGSPRLDGVGAGFSEGTVTVEGPVGQRLGAGMSGGTLRVRGSAGPFSGVGATGGLIEIHGDAGERAGGAPYGAPVGLNGATLVVRGRAGTRLGDRMRRGLIVTDTAEDHAGTRMIGGTIVAGTVGAAPGYAMRRGTLLVGGHGPLISGFVPTGTHRLVFARLLHGILRRLAPDLAGLAEGDLERRAGDLATLGKGELLTPRR
ncbi:formylmethanofuran dehydrogenase subunit C [Salinarimonas soli]|uniref:Formylmethanofuran dehydrogenase subunit C n=1 Tax=Salinarimonas soli TaxID=1638099 RepID=A0A5B2VF58_9HYPH|nr:formylmethanofuran dehydrogenase subunit C [Salinarimonas soli]KAA2237495.1 formylmethanofuran dehydrogenase subunit C [Salinarimonas soli]